MSDVMKKVNEMLNVIFFRFFSQDLIKGFISSSFIKIFQTDIWLWYISFEDVAWKKLDWFQSTIKAFVILMESIFLALITRTSLGWSELHFSFLTDACYMNFNFLRIHDVAALANWCDRLLRAMWTNSKITWHWETLAKSSTSILRKQKIQVLWQFIEFMLMNMNFKKLTVVSWNSTQSGMEIFLVYPTRWQPTKLQFYNVITYILIY